MGADLLLHVLGARIDACADGLYWDKGFNLLANMSDEQILAIEPFESYGDDAADARDTLRGDLDELRRYWTQEAEDRISMRTRVGDVELFIYGAQTWGDSPSEFFDAITRLANVEDLLPACGFLP